MSVADHAASSGTCHASVQRTSKAWQVNRDWVLAASIAADLAAWTRPLGPHDRGDLKDAEPGTLRLWRIPARLVRHARQRLLKIPADRPWKDAFRAG